MDCCHCKSILGRFNLSAKHFRDESVMRRAYMALKSYCRSLMGSNKYDAEAMPRLLTIWLDITANAKKQAAWAEKINLTVQKAAKGILPLQVNSLRLSMSFIL